MSSGLSGRDVAPVNLCMGSIMPIIRLTLCFFFLFIGTNPAMAEFYRYYDENGALRFTDNIAEVPEDQLPEIKHYDEEKDYLTPQEQAARARAERQIEKQNTHEGKSSAIRRVEVKSPDDLQGVREQLDDDFADLEYRKEQLQAERATLSTPEQVRAYKEKVRTLNEDIKRFESRRQEFVKKAKKYNALTN